MQPDLIRIPAQMGAQAGIIRQFGEELIEVGAQGGPPPGEAFGLLVEVRCGYDLKAHQANAGLDGP